MRSTGVGDTLVKQRNDSSELFSLSLVIDRLVSYFYNRRHFMTFRYFAIAQFTMLKRLIYKVTHLGSWYKSTFLYKHIIFETILPSL